MTITAETSVSVSDADCDIVIDPGFFGDPRPCCLPAHHELLGLSLCSTHYRKVTERLRDLTDPTLGDDWFSTDENRLRSGIFRRVCP